MADVFAVNAANGYDSSPAVMTGSFDDLGRMRVINDRYQATGQAIGTDIIIGRVYEDSRIQVDTTIYHDALGGSSTLELLLRTVDGATETSLITAVSTSSAGIIVVTITDIDNFPAVVAEESDLILKTAGGTVTGTIVTNIRLTID